MGLLTASELHNRQVIASESGERLGVVKDLLIDTDARTVAGFVISGAKGEQKLPYDKVRTIGPDAVMVGQAVDLVEASGGPVNARRLSDLGKLQVLSTGGSHLGAIDDLSFNALGGGIETWQLGEGGVFGLGKNRQPVANLAVKSIGPDAATVELEANAPA